MYRKRAKGWTKHLDFMLLDILCMQLAFVISYIIRFGTDNPYMDNEYRILAIAFLFIDFFVEIVSDSFFFVLLISVLSPSINSMTPISRLVSRRYFKAPRPAPNQ